MGFTFPKNEKLKSKKLIDQLFREGKGITSFPIKIIYLKTPLSKEVKFQAGVTVAKRNFKSAVDRNRIKRLLRESYRLNKPLIFNNMEGNFAFLILYLGKEMPTYLEIEQSMLGVFQKILNHVNNEKRP